MTASIPPPSNRLGTGIAKVPLAPLVSILFFGANLRLRLAVCASVDWPIFGLSGPR